MVKVKPSIVESSSSMSTKKPSYLRLKKKRSIVVRFLKPPFSTAEVVGHDERPVGDGGDLDFGAPEVPQCHGEQKKEKHQPWHYFEI